MSAYIWFYRHTLSFIPFGNIADTASNSRWHLLLCTRDPPVCPRLLSPSVRTLSELKLVLKGRVFLLQVIEVVIARWVEVAARGE